MRKARPNTSRYTSLNLKKMAERKLKPKKFVLVDYAKIDVATTCVLQIRIQSKMQSAKDSSLLIKVEEISKRLNFKKLAIFIKKAVANKRFKYST